VYHRKTVYRQWLETLDIAQVSTAKVAYCPTPPPLAAVAQFRGVSGSDNNDINIEIKQQTKIANWNIEFVVLICSFYCFYLIIPCL